MNSSRLLGLPELSRNIWISSGLLRIGTVLQVEYLYSVLWITSGLLRVRMNDNWITPVTSRLLQITGALLHLISGLLRMTQIIPDKYWIIWD